MVKIMSQKKLNKIIKKYIKKHLKTFDAKYMKLSYNEDTGYIELFVELDKKKKPD